MSPSAAPSALNEPRASASAERRLVMVEALAELSMQVAQVCGREALEAAAGVSAARGVHGAAQAEARAASPEVAPGVMSEVASTAPPERVDEAADPAAPTPAVTPAFTPEFNPVVVAETKAAASAAALAVASLAAAHGEAMLAFSRAARAAQMSVALWERLERRQAQGAAAEARAAVEARHAETLDRRARAERLASRLAEAHFEAALPAEADDETAIAAVQGVVREARERLADEDLFGDLAARPFSEIVARLCRDLGLAPDWSRLAGEPWAQAEIAAGAAPGGAPGAADRGADGLGVGAPLALFARHPGAVVPPVAAPPVGLVRPPPPRPQARPRRLQVRLDDDLDEGLDDEAVDPPPGPPPPPLGAPSTRWRRRLKAERAPPPELAGPAPPEYKLKVIYVDGATGEESEDPRVGRPRRPDGSYVTDDHDEAHRPAGGARRHDVSLRDASWREAPYRDAYGDRGV